MTPDVLDRRLAQQLEALAPPLVPQEIDDLLARTAAIRQRPGWTFLRRWPPMRVSFLPSRSFAIPRALAILLVLALAILVAIAVLLLVGGGRRQAPPFGITKAGLVAYSNQGGIWVDDGSGRNGRPFLAPSGSVVYRSPTFSPDGLWMAFWADTGFAVDEGQVEVVHVDGGQLVVVSGGPVVPTSQERRIAWSPDSRRLAFGIGGKGGAGPSILIGSVDGGTPVRLETGGVAGDDPSWSPDGRTIAFRGQVSDRGVALFTVAASGGPAVQISHKPGDLLSSDFTSPQWSPDGTRLLTYNGSSSGQHDIYIVRVDGTGETDVSNNPEDEYWPAWSPDGRRIVYSRGPNQAVVYFVVADADGSHEVVLDRAYAGGMAAPMWSPDQSRLLAIVCIDEHCTSVANAILDPTNVSPPVIIAGTPPDAVGTNGHPSIPTWQRLP